MMPKNIAEKRKKDLDISPEERKENSEERREPDSDDDSPIDSEEGKIGYILLWLIGIPLPVILILYFIFR